MEALFGVVGNVWDQFGLLVTRATTGNGVIMLMPIAFGIANATVGIFRKATRIGSTKH